MKTLWGFVPFQQDTFAIKGTFKQIQQLASGPKNVHIGYIVTGDETFLNTAFDIPASQRFSVYPKKLILEELNEAKVPIDKSRIHIIQFQTLSTTKSVDRFLALARSQKVELLALFTHGKRGFSRFILGSFAETAIHRSPLHLLIINPKSKASSHFKNVFFASDFSNRSKKDFLQVLKICKSLKAELTVFHAAEVIYKWSLDERNPEILAYRRSTDKMAKWIEDTSSMAKVPCEVIVKSEFRSIFEQILKGAKKSKTDLIVVSAETGPTAALMGGSITRQIVRNGKYPVLVLKHRGATRS